MILEKEQWAPYVMGALRSEEKDGFVFFSRFTKKQEEYNVQRGKGNQNRASSGMKLEFDTSAQTLSFLYRIEPGSSRGFYGLDLLINGHNVKSVQEQRVPDEGTFLARLEPGNKRVCLTLPNLNSVGIRNLTLDAPMTPRVRHKKMLTLGDSITQGYDARHPYLSYANQLADALDMDMLNQAIGGDCFDANNLDELLPFAPDCITVAYGTNDWARGKDVIQNGNAYFAKLRTLYPTQTIYAILPIWRIGADGNPDAGCAGKTLQDVRDEIAQTARKYGAVVINAANFVPRAEDYFSDRALHPNDLGFLFYAKNLIREMTK